MPQSLSFFEEPSSQPLVGIARMAAQGESITAGHDVEYFTLPVRSLLNRCTSPRMPFAWTINPYRGCEFACKYCYARYTHEFMEMRDGLDFERKIYVKQGVGWLLRQDLKKVKPGEGIALGTATDPYQPAERRYELTRAILEELAQHAGLELGIITKSNLILRDLDVLKHFNEHNRLSIHVTVTTMNVQLARILEPRAPRPDLRIEAVGKLAEAGLHVAVNCAPVVPAITDSPADLDAVVRASALAGARNIHAHALYLRPCSAKVFMPFLEKEFPQLVEKYQLRYGASPYVSKSYEKRISELMARLKAKHGIGQKDERREALPVTIDAQMKLF